MEPFTIKWTYNKKIKKSGIKRLWNSNEAYTLSHPVSEKIVVGQRGLRMFETKSNPSILSVLSNSYSHLH